MQSRHLHRSFAAKTAVQDDNAVDVSLWYSVPFVVSLVLKPEN